MDCHICGEKLEYKEEQKISTCSMCQKLGHMDKNDTKNCPICKAIEHNCSFVNGIAIDDMGNEYRDENGQAVTV